MPPLQPSTSHNMQAPTASTPTKAHPFGGPRTPKVGILAQANRLRDASNNHSPGTGPAGLAAAAAGGGGGRNVSGALFGAGPMPGAALVVETQRYEEWMKIATDNKITSTNTWNLALIDYFHDMRLLRNGEDNSINFQKASCTLDGCVKIWTSRVDSVATETGKLLSGLAEDGRPAQDDLDEQDDDAEDDDEGSGGKKKQRKNKPQAATLADSFDKLRYKFLEQEFTVDPLFKKTSADFDEGGAGGILMNHLGCDGNMKVVFDAGDAKLECDDEEDEEEDEEEEEGFDLKVDIGRLMYKFIPDLNAIDQMTLCPSLASFRFSPDANLDLDIFNPVDDILPSQNSRPRAPVAPEGADGDAMDMGDDPWAGHDFGGGGTAGDDGDDDMGGGGQDDFFADLGKDTALNGPQYQRAWNSEGPEFSGGDGGGNGHGGGEANGEVELTMDGGARGGNMFDELDRALAKNWAGPEHWKMRRVAIRKTADETKPKEKKEKVAFSIDFEGPQPIPFKELFAPATSLSTIQTAPRSRKSSAAPSVAKGRRTSSKSGAGSSGTASEKLDNYTLPDDYGFNGDVLLRLFLKPKVTLKFRRRGGAVGIGAGGGQAVVLPVGYPANAGADDIEGGFFGFGDDGGAMGDEGDDDMGGMGEFDVAAPFQTQFLADEDDIHYLGADDDEEGMEDDLMQATQGTLRRVKPDMIGHAKKAKRVDVKRLKDSIWRELEEVAIPVKELPTDSVYVPEKPTSADDEEAKPTESLVPVIDGLRKSYPTDKMEEISTSFCFICLLHLANEKGLRIQAPDTGAADDGNRERAAVSGLDALRVFKELAV